MSKIIDQQLKVYRESFLQHPDSPLGTRQNNQETQFLRFEKMLQNIMPYAAKPFSIHDIGAGTCDLHKFLIDNNVEHQYSGTEIVEEMNVISRAKYKDITLVNRDILSSSPDEKYDFVVLSGTFNFPGDGSREEWKEFIFMAINRMYEMCNCAVVFNLLTTYKTFTDGNLIYVNPAEVFNHCIKLSRFVNLDHSYPLYEYTVTVFRKEFIAQSYPDEAFQKYFKN